MDQSAAFDSGHVDGDAMVSIIDLVLGAKFVKNDVFHRQGDDSLNIREGPRNNLIGQKQGHDAEHSR